MKTKKSKVHRTPDSHVDTYPSSLSDSSASEAEDEDPHRRYTLNPFADCFVLCHSPRMAKRQFDKHVNTFTVPPNSVVYI